MNISFQQLKSQLNKTMSQVYILTGDTTLLINESAQQIHNAAKKNGFDECKRIEVTRNFDWSTLLIESQNEELFSQKKIIDIRNSNNYCDAKAKKAMLQLAEQTHDDLIVIFRFGKLSSAQLNSSWFKKLSEPNITIHLKAPTPEQMPQWILKRARHYGCTITNEASSLLAEMTEGQLLATDQALQKCLLLKHENITADHIINITSDNAQHSVFDLSDHLLQGDSRKCLLILKRLLEQGTEPTLISWAITREIRMLFTMAILQKQGKPESAVFAKVWSSKKNLYKKALQRHEPLNLAQLIKTLSVIDKIIKGAIKDSIPIALQKILVEICNKKTTVQI
jgi:DNA polymerase III subunit delta